MLLDQGSESLNTYREFLMDVDDDGRASIPIEIAYADGTKLEEYSFYFSSHMAKSTARPDILAALGYSDTSCVNVPITRLGLVDLQKIEMTQGDENVLGANVLKFFDLKISYGDKTLGLDLVDRIKRFADKGFNPNVKFAFDSHVRSSRYNASESFMNWAAIDAKYPESWILFWGGDDEADYGGEVIWQSAEDIPETIQDNTFLYCNKSIAKMKPMAFTYQSEIRNRRFTEPSPDFASHIEQLEGLLILPTIPRFYYDVISRQGRYITNKKETVTSDNSSQLLSQAQIDALVAQMLG